VIVSWYRLAWLSWKTAVKWLLYTEVSAVLHVIWYFRCSVTLVICMCLHDRAGWSCVWYGVVNNVYISGWNRHYTTTLLCLYFRHIGHHQMHIFSRSWADADTSWRAQRESSFVWHLLRLCFYYYMNFTNITVFWYLVWLYLFSLFSCIAISFTCNM